MKEHFKKQIEKSILITEDLLDRLKGQSIYGRYKLNDRVLYFLEITEDNGLNNIILRAFAERELKKLEDDFIFIENHSDIPLLKRKEIKNEKSDS